MNHHKGSAAITALLIVLGIAIAAGIGYAVMNPQMFQAPAMPAGETAQQDDGIQREPGDHPEEDREAGEGMAGEARTSIAWRFTSAEEIEGMPYTNVTVAVNGKAYDMGKFIGSCSEVGANGGIDGKGLLIGELSAAQCWFAGGGSEIGVFGHEDGGVEIMVGELSEGEEGSGLFRGNFSIKNTIRF